MPLSGELTDLSLAELIEFFCNQRKTGCLDVTYQKGDGHFYLESGSLVHASIGVLRGIEAVHYALTLSNASFTFKTSVAAPEQTIDQSWTSVVLEGLRLMDEGVSPPDPFPDEAQTNISAPKAIDVHVEGSEKLAPIPLRNDEVIRVSTTRVAPVATLGTLLSQAEGESPFAYGPRKLAAIFAAVILIVAVIAIPWGWYARSKTAKFAAETQNAATEKSQPSAAAPNTAVPETSEPVANGQPTPANESKEVTVQVTYDENGHVTQASGGDAEALRLAKQKRFPAGKAGSATVTIPLN